MRKKELRAWKVSPALFDGILTRYSDKVVKVDDLTPYKNGTPFNASIYYDGIKQLVCRENILLNNGTPDWYQCIAIFDINLKGETYQQAITGGMAWKVFKEKILQYYTPEAFDACLKAVGVEYDERVNQMHFAYYAPRNAPQRHCILRFSNCYEYDINGAYASVLIDIFPKAKDEIVRLYNERKLKPLNKDIINYAVGMMCRTGYREAYNYIVQRIRKQMEAEVRKVGGRLVYANTDGFVVASPKQLLSAGNNLGQFKLEYAGEVYVYEGANYWIMQCGTKLKGSAPWMVRDKIDLSQGITVSYKRKRCGCTYTAEAVEIRRIEIYEESR